MRKGSAPAGGPDPGFAQQFDDVGLDDAETDIAVKGLAPRVQHPPRAALDAQGLGLRIVGHEYGVGLAVGQAGVDIGQVGAGPEEHCIQHRGLGNITPLLEEGLSNSQDGPVATGR